MTRIYATFAAVLLLIVFGGGTWFGHRWGKSDRADEVVQLTRANAALTGERDTARQVAQDNAGSLAAIREQLQQEQRAHALIQAAKDEELGKRADRIAALERGTEQRKKTLHKEAAANEDCAALRDLPVCAAVADRLWGGAATAGPH